jgi:hypothetical protein
MFYTLHRLVKWFFILLALACLVWLYTQREALQPVWAWYDVYENGGIAKTEPLPVLDGEGVAVIDGHTFQMKSEGKFYSVRLTGFEIPESPLSQAEVDLEKRRRETLRGIIVGKPLHVQISYSNQNALLGIVHAGVTNLNTLYVTSGLSRFNRDYVKSTPRDLQYKFFAASRAKANDPLHTRQEAQ